MTGQETGPDKALTFTCRCCGEVHEGIPAFSSEAPDYWGGLTESQRRNGFLDSDFCVTGQEHFYVRAMLYIPIRNTDHQFGWGVWGSLSKANFDRYRDLWKADDVSGEEPYFSYLSNTLPIYPDTMNLKTNLHLQPGGLRPFVELEPTDHPLAVDQRKGITLERAIEVAEMLLHPEEGSVRKSWWSRLTGR